ncbi:MAG: imidazole glycerol phosphate synthase subunit HisH [Pyrinomonadaceae bacterium]|uniref:imidazole glycerol phosphate synthase subunit HisH n=1 Tax=Pseudomonas sp. TaxID=306 RepID=UPI003D6ED1D9
MITIVDYGLGNIQAFVNVYRRLHIPVAVAKSAAELEGATKIILPGVGAFDHAIERLDASGMRPVLDKLVVESKIPVLGICVGMQILSDSSEEGTLPGLGWVPGKVRSFKAIPELSDLPLPHMGWNDVSPSLNNSLFKGFEEEVRFYFLHSFFFDCLKPEHIAASSNYGLDFSCAVRADNVYGVQFHPEKSHHFGVGLLKNFAEL